MDHQENYDSKLEQVVEAVETKGSQDTNLIPLSSGVVLERIPFSRNILMDLFHKFKEPKVPTFTNPDKEREEENPNDPDYIKAKEKYDAEVGMALFDAGICLGTKMHYVPKKSLITGEDIPNPYDESWVETYEGLGIEIPKAPKLRYLRWVKYFAAVSEEDVMAIADSVLPTVGVREKTVSDAINTFPGEAVRK